MLSEYNNDDKIFSFLMDEESKKNFIESQYEYEKELASKRAENRGEKRGVKKAKLQTAKKMLSKHFSFKDIEEITGFSSDYLKTIKV